MDDKYLFINSGFCSRKIGYDVKDKSNNIRNYMSYMFARTQSIFKYNGLPDSIPKRALELQEQWNGFTCITKVNDKLYAFYGGLGGEYNEYYMPTICTVANPALKFNKMLKIGEECVIIPNDSMYLGLFPLFHKYATQLAENDVTIRLADISARIQQLLSASDDNTRKSAEEYLKKIEKGDLGIIGDNAFLQSLRVQTGVTSGASNHITQLIELQQYLRAGWFNEIGLNANYNMKREAINSDEAQMGNDALLPLIDDMLNCRREGWKKVNELFGTNVEVSLDSSWEDRQEITDAEIEQAETDAEDQNVEVVEDENVDT